MTNKSERKNLGFVSKGAALRLAGCLWLCVLALALAVSAISSDRRALQVEEYAAHCDPFGYLQIAQDARQAVATTRLPNFSIESPHGRLLIELMKSRGLPLNYWDDMVAPLCYHYSPRANHIGVQYPPGAGLMLAIFPQGEALHRLDRVVTALFLVTGLAILLVAAGKRAWLSAGLLTLALTIGLEMLARIDNASFSINAMFAPLLLTSLCLSAAFGLRAETNKSFWVSWLLTFLAGLSFGFAILVRLQVSFLLPGLVVLLWPPRLRDWLKSGLLSFLAGVLIGGILPVIINQSRVTGAWYESTYGIGNTDPPTLKSFWSNLHFYFDPGKASQFNWALVVMVLACLGLFVWTRGNRGRKDPAAFLSLSWLRLVLAALFMWTIPTLYFLTHEVTGHHYPLATIFLTSLMLALGSLKLESDGGYGEVEETQATSRHKRWPWQGLRVAGLLLAAVAGLFAISEAWSNYAPASAERRPRQFSLPADLVDERVWIWAGELSGSLWYYARKPAHKINFSSDDARMIAYQFVQDRAEPQYIINDGPDMQRMLDEMVRFGATLERRGEVDGQPYFLIHWPTGGPLRKR